MFGLFEHAKRIFFGGEDEQFNRLMELRYEFERKLDSFGRNDKFYLLLNDFTLDSMVVSKSDGSVVLGNGGSRIESVKGSALFEYIKSELPDTNYIMIRTQNGTRVIYSDGAYIYIARSRGYVSPLEMRLLAENLREDLDGGRED